MNGLGEAAGFTGTALILWFIIGIVRGLPPPRVRQWFHAQPERTWILVLAAAVLMVGLLGEGFDRASIVEALNISIATVGADQIRKRTSRQGLDDLVNGAIRRTTASTIEDGPEPHQME